MIDHDTTYAARMAVHLSAYKRDVLGILDDGVYTYRPGRTRAYGHILPPEHRWLNIPAPFREEIRAFVEAKCLKLHRHFNHLNSSQAFALALFYPYLTYAPEILAAAFGVRSMTDWQFEEVPDIAEGTNVDVSWVDTDSKTYCEVKLTETSFGSCKPNEDRRIKLRERYRPTLEPFVKDSKLLDEDSFFQNYQLLRNLWLVLGPGSATSKVVFFLPRANRGPLNQLESLADRLSAELWARVLVVDLESVLMALRGAIVPTRLTGYADILAAKYLVD